MTIKKDDFGLNYSQIGARLKAFRLEHKWNQKFFANILSTSQGYLSEVENGKGKPTIEMLEGLISEFPDINLRWLFRGDGEVFTRRYFVDSIDKDIVMMVNEFLEPTYLEDSDLHIHSPEFADRFADWYDTFDSKLKELISAGIKRKNAISLIRRAFNLSEAKEIMEVDSWDLYYVDDPEDNIVKSGSNEPPDSGIDESAEAKSASSLSDASDDK